MTINIKDKKTIRKLSQLSSKKHKNIEEIIVELVDHYNDSEENNINFTKRYKKLNPLEHSTLLNFDDSVEDLDNVKLFENVSEINKNMES